MQPPSSKPRYLSRLLLGVAGALLVAWLGAVVSGTDGTVLQQAELPVGVSMKALLHRAIHETAAAGRKIVAIAKSGNLKEKSKGIIMGSMVDPVTAADLLSHQLLSRGFRAAFPSVTLVSEEKDSEGSQDAAPEGSVPASVTQAIDAAVGPVLASQGDSRVAAEDVVVWIDPLDATKEYTEGLHQYVTVMACVAVGGVSVAGVVHFPFTQRTVWGWVGSGTPPHNSSLAGGVSEPVAPPPSPPSWQAAGLRAIVSRSHAGKVASQLTEAGLEVAGITPAGGAGYKVAQVLAGAADAYVHATRIKKWDVCAGDALLRAAAAQDGGGWAGGMSDWAGGPIAYSADSEAVLEGGLLAVRDAGLYAALQPKLAGQHEAPGA